MRQRTWKSIGRCVGVLVIHIREFPLNAFFQVGAFDKTRIFTLFYSSVTLSFFKVCEQLTRIVTSKISIDEVTNYCELVNGAFDQLNIRHS